MTNQKDDEALVLEKLLANALSLVEPYMPKDDQWMNRETDAWKNYYQAITDRTPTKTELSPEELAAALAINAQNQETQEQDFWALPSRDDWKKALGGIKMGGEIPDNATLPPQRDDRPLNVEQLLQGLEPKEARPDDPLVHGAILPLTKNQRTGNVDWDIQNAGLVNTILNGIKYTVDMAEPGLNAMVDPTKLAETAGPIDEVTLAQNEQASNAIQNEQAGDAFLTSIGLTASPALFGRTVMPNELTMGVGFRNLKDKMATTTSPVAFDIVDVTAPKGLQSIEKPMDLYKAQFVDNKQVLMDLADRAGLPNREQLNKMISQDTQNSALMRVNEAMRSGRLATQSGSIQFKTPPNVIVQKYKSEPVEVQKDVDTYLKLLDYSDDLKLALNMKPSAALSAKLATGDKNAKKEVASIAKTVQRAQVELVKVNEQIAALKTTRPVVLEYENAYKDVTSNVRQFLSFGRNAIFNPKTVNSLAVERPNYVPVDLSGVDPEAGLLTRIAQANETQNTIGAWDWFTKKRDITAMKGIENRINSMDMLLDYTKNALQHKMENDVRGAYIDALLASPHGSKTIRRLKPEEQGKYADRQITVYENGKPRTYVTSKLQANLLKFDPNVAKFPIAMALRSVFQHGTTGALNPGFAFTTAIRDTLTGAVLTEKGISKPGPLSTIASIPQVAIPKLALETSNLMRSSFKHIPFIDDVTTSSLADRLANHYAKSMYALSNQVGGTDASLMKNSIEYGRGTMREVAKTADQIINKIPYARPTVDVLRAAAHGWEGLFNAISDAPRFAVFKKELEAGASPETAAMNARKLTGDPGRSGQPYLADGKRISADVKNPAWLAPAPATALTSVFLRDAVPYWNASLQGMRRLATRFVENPARTTLQGWAYVGLPVLAATAWNDMLGKEYNDYAQQQRSAVDQAMNIYIAVPGQPPEKGIEIPIGHEMTPWNSLWSKAIWLMARDDKDIGEKLMEQGLTILQNGSSAAFPPIVGLPMTVAGMNPPDSLNDFFGGASPYKDNKLFTENVEKTTRALFGGISDIVMNSAAAAYDGGPEAFFDELGWQLGRKTPIVKNLIGSKYAITSFTPAQEKGYRKMEAFTRFKTVYDEWYGDNADKVRAKLAKPADNQNIDDPALTKLAPNLGVEPTNPVFKPFGAAIREALGTNELGIRAVKDRNDALNEQIRLLKGYNAGRRDAFAKYQKEIIGSTNKYQQILNAKNELMQSGKLSSDKIQIIDDKLSQLKQRSDAEQLINDLKIDLSKRSDVIRLINHLEKQRFNLVGEQLKIIDEVETTFTLELQKAGILKQGQRFDIEKHLDPYLTTLD